MYMRVYPSYIYNIIYIYIYTCNASTLWHRYLIVKQMYFFFLLTCTCVHMYVCRMYVYFWAFFSFFCLNRNKFVFSLSSQSRTPRARIVLCFFTHPITRREGGGRGREGGKKKKEPWPNVCVCIIIINESSTLSPGTFHKSTIRRCT